MFHNWHNFALEQYQVRCQFEDAVVVLIAAQSTVVAVVLTDHSSNVWERMVKLSPSHRFQAFLQGFLFVIL